MLRRKEMQFNFNQATQEFERNPNNEVGGNITINRVDIADMPGTSNITITTEIFQFENIDNIRAALNRLIARVIIPNFSFPITRKSVLVIDTRRIEEAAFGPFVINI
jgi:hypothetical protein